MIEEIEKSKYIQYTEGWDFKRVRSATKLKCGYWIDTVYDYDTISAICNKRAKYMYYINEDDNEPQELCPYMWQEVTNTIEETRKLVFETYIDFGVNECEAHFLAIKTVISSLKKFRIKFFNIMGGKIDRSRYNKTALRTAINALIVRFEGMNVTPDYLFSKTAVDPKLEIFRTEVAWETARILAEDTGVVLQAKLSL